MLVRGPRLLTRFRLPDALVALTVLYGTLGYLLLEGWSLTDALYMTVTTPATVGYGEVRPLDPSGPGPPLPARAGDLVLGPRPEQTLKAMAG